MSDQRPNPEKILQRIKQEEEHQQQGKLKIYLGAAPGVGKTYAMLQDALTKRNQGLDVVVGIVESHGRCEIEALLKPLTVLPLQQVEYHGKVLTEFDLEAALKRQPSLLLIDEMAHQNIPGLRHKKRWQDIREILHHGIDVYTTLNVQHIESLNDVVAQIIHSRVKETVPDSMLEVADMIELVDIPPEDLLKRLQEGKVYFPEQAALAKDHFFRKGNLTALRELALRVTAEQVGTQVLLYRQDLGIKHIWPTKEKILVCVGGEAESSKLIRIAKRMAANAQTDWMAIYVEVPWLRRSEEKRNNAMQNLRLAELLGAQIRTLTGFDIVKEIMAFAREQNITQIVVEKKIRSRWYAFIFGSLADDIVRQSKEIDVYIVTSEPSHDKYTKKPTITPKNTWKNYFIATGFVLGATILNYFFCTFLSDSSLIMVYILAVIGVALSGQSGPAIFASILSVLTYDYFFVPPAFGFATVNIQSFFTLLSILIIMQIISHLTILTRRQAEAARLAEHQTAALYTLSRQLAATRGIHQLLEKSIHYIGEAFDSEIMALLPAKDKNNLLVLSKYKTLEEELPVKEQGIAKWVYDLGQMAGLGTNTLPFSKALYVPLLTPQGVIGVLRIQPIRTYHLFTADLLHLLEVCANQIALAIEAEQLHS
jgi:two-component system sensor histidine kinase KdpD